MSANHCAQREPTLRQMEVLAAVEKHREQHGHAPTVRELGDLLGISSTNCTAEHLRAIENKGLLERVPRAARTLRATAKGLRFLSAFVPSSQGGRASFNLRRSESDEIKAGCPAVNEGEGA